MIPSLTNLLDILSHLLSGIYSDILSHMFSGIYSDILSHVEKRVKISASLATTSTAISDLQRRRWPLYMRVCVRVNPHGAMAEPRISHILSGILSGIFSAILSDIFSGIMSDHMF